MISRFIGFFGSLASRPAVLRDAMGLEFRTMCRLLQEVELFLTVRHAVKHGDVGMLRRVVDPLVVVFFGAGQHNYGREMLYYRWLLSDVNTPELQHAILAAGLVNWPGRATADKPIDLSLEHLNAGDMDCYKNSTHDVDIIFDRVCLCNTFTRELRQHMESAFSPYIPDAHNTPSAVLDMFSLARSLFSSKLAARRPGADLHGKYRRYNRRDRGDQYNRRTGSQQRSRWTNKCYICGKEGCRSTKLGEGA